MTWRFWRIGISFLLVFLLCNVLTEWHEFDALGITLWSPDNGLSLALLIESIAFAPFVFVGAVLADVFIVRVQHDVFVTTAAELVSTIAYVSLALILRYKLKFNLRETQLSGVMAFLVIIPAGTILSSSLYCIAPYMGKRAAGF